MHGSVLIIGGSSSIGQALARHYHNAGATVAVLSRRPAQASPPYYWYQDMLHNTADSEACIGQALQHQPDHIFICNGVLHDDMAMPEKTLRQLDTAVLMQRLQTNVAVPAHYLQALLRYLSTTPAVKLLALSAKVGSIADNRLGGWYSYRISKAALNMLVKTTAIEVARLNKTAVVVSVHPGTTDTPLSQPFQANLPDGQLQTSQSTALRLAAVAQALTPEHSGQLLNWDGSVLPY